MTLQDSVFYLLSIASVLSASLVITLQHPVKAVFSLIVTFVSVSGLWMLLEVEFLSILLLLVYVGAVLVLFLFVVMMLDIEEHRNKERFTKYLPVAVCVSVWLILGLIMANGPKYFGLDVIKAPTPYATDFSHLMAVATLLYSEYLYPLEVAGVILLVAMIAAITLTFRESRSKKVEPYHQIKVRKVDRVQLVNIDQKSSIFQENNSGEKE